MPTALEVTGLLTVLGDSGSLRVEFQDDVIALVLPDLRSALALRRKLPRGARRAWLLRARDLLARTGLELQVWVGGRKVARLAGGTRSGLLAASLGLTPMELTLRSFLPAFRGER